jgi:CheY-like chemotaxis protein
MRTLRILCVDDDADTCLVIRRALEHAGHVVETAGTCADARAKLLGAAPYDLLVCDLGLPDGNGWDLMADARQRGTTGIALSGHAYDEDVRHSLDAGFASHVTKPATLNQLIAAIEAATRIPPQITDGSHNAGLTL